MKKYKNTIYSEWYIYIWIEADILGYSSAKYLNKHKRNMRQRNYKQSNLWKMKRRPNTQNKSEILKVKKYQSLKQQLEL